VSYVWQTHLRDEVSFDPVYHQNPRTEIASFINDPPGVVLDIGCGGGATGKLIKEKFPGTRVIGIESNPYAGSTRGSIWMTFSARASKTSISPSM